MIKAQRRQALVSSVYISPLVQQPKNSMTVAISGREMSRPVSLLKPLGGITFTLAAVFTFAPYFVNTIDRPSRHLMTLISLPLGNPSSRKELKTSRNRLGGDGTSIHSESIYIHRLKGPAFRNIFQNAKVKEAGAFIIKVQCAVPKFQGLALTDIQFEQDSDQVPKSYSSRNHSLRFAQELAANLTKQASGNVIFAVVDAKKTEECPNISPGFRYLYAQKQCLSVVESDGYFGKRSGPRLRCTDN